MDGPWTFYVVVHRRRFDGYPKGALVQTREYKRLLKRIGVYIREGYFIEAEHRILPREERIKYGNPYDMLKVRVWRQS